MVWKDLQTCMTMPRHTKIPSMCAQHSTNLLFSRLAFMLSQICSFCSSLESHKSYHLLPIKKRRTTSPQTSRQSCLWHCRCSCCRTGCCRGSRSRVGRFRRGMDGGKNLMVARGWDAWPAKMEGLETRGSKQIWDTWADFGLLGGDIIDIIRSGNLPKYSNHVLQGDAMAPDSSPTAPCARQCQTQAGREAAESQPRPTGMFRSGHPRSWQVLLEEPPSACLLLSASIDASRQKLCWFNQEWQVRSLKKSRWTLRLCGFCEFRRQSRIYCSKVWKEEGRQYRGGLCSKDDHVI